MKPGLSSVKRTTLSREAYLALRSAILRRRRPPGSKLVVRVLAEQLGLSPTPIKEALAALEREGLVVAVPHRGYFVPQLTTDDIEELYAIREVIEGLGARLAAERGGGRLHEQLRRLLTQQRASVRQRDIERYGDLDLAFHRLLWESAGNRRLVQAAEAFSGQVRLLLSSSATIPGRLGQSLNEHDAIARGVLDGDPARAEAAMRQHVRRASEALRAYLEKGAISALA